MQGLYPLHHVAKWFGNASIYKSLTYNIDKQYITFNAQNIYHACKLSKWVDDLIVYKIVCRKKDCAYVNNKDSYDNSLQLRSYKKLSKSCVSE